MVLLLISRSTLLQTNAMVIAGLLILLTIQSPGSISARDLQIEGKLLEKDVLALNEMSDKISKRFKENNWLLDNDTASYLIIKQYDSILQTEKFFKSTEIFNELPWHEKILLSPTWPANILIIPFSLSCAIELFLWQKRKNEEVSKAGITLSYIGFAMMVAIFVTNFIMPIF